MRQSFYDIYRNLYREFILSRVYHYEDRIPHPFYSYNDLSLLRELQRIIEAEEYSLEGTKLRPDAKYFLLLNFHDMVILPIVMARGKERTADSSNYNINDPGLIDDKKLIEDLEHDVRLVIKEAVENENNSPQSPSPEEQTGKEISGHSIIKILDDFWTRLKVSEYLYWT